MLGGSYERIIAKYTLAKESGLISSTNYMGKMSVGFEGFCSILTQNWVIEKQKAACWDIGAIGRGK